MSVAPTNASTPGLPAASAHRALRRSAAIGVACHAGVLLAGITAKVNADAATWFGVRGPHCMLGSCLGPMACPGCGLVRSTAAVLHGDLDLAWRMHPAGPIVALLASAGILLHVDILRRGIRTAQHVRLSRVGRACFLLAVLFGWLIRWNAAA